jgi:4-amino-4-deoxy-L-arabinose transferase-like glycosyltransferase
MKFFKDEHRTPLQDLATLFIVFGVLFFQFLGHLPLIDPDEGRYVEIPREMLERGDFITPTLNYVKYFEKPPLHYWLNALSLSIFGENEFAARFAGTMCGLFTVLLTYWLGRKLFNRRTGVFAATLLGTAVGFLVQARINFTDMTLTFCLTAAFAFFMLAVREEGKSKGRNYYLFYLFMALAVLAKGLIGIVLPGAVIFLYLAVTKRWRLLKEMRLATGGLLFLLVCAPWFILVSIKNPEFPHFFFIHEHFQRFLTKVHHRYQPAWFFIPVLLGTMLPWSLFIPAALRKGWQERKSSGDMLFLLLWAGVIFAFFSKSDSKLIPYILPVFPPLALLMGKWFVEVKGGLPVRRCALATGMLLLIVGGGIVAYPRVAHPAAIGTTACTIIGSILVGQALLCMLAARTGDAVRVFSTLALTACIFIVAGPPVAYDDLEAGHSARELAKAIDQNAGKDAKIVCFDGYEQGIPFYTHRRVVVAGDRDELEFGSMQGDHSAWFVDKAAFLRMWDTPQPLLAVLRKRDLPVVQILCRTRPDVVATAGDRVLITNHGRTAGVAAGAPAPASHPVTAQSGSMSVQQEAEVAPSKKQGGL